MIIHMLYALIYYWESCIIKHYRNCVSIGIKGFRIGDIG